MNDSPATIISEILFAANLFGRPTALPLDWPLYLGFVPDKVGIPDEIAAIFDTEGVKDGRLMSGKNILHHGVQILTRSLARRVGYEKLAAVEALIEQLSRTSVMVGSNTYMVVNVSQTSPILSLGHEEGDKRRSLYTINALCTITDEAGGGPVPVPTTGARRTIVRYTTDHTVTADESNYVLVANGTAPLAFTLPTWDEGLTYEFFNNVGFPMQIRTSSGDKFKAAGALWDTFTGGTSGDKIQMVATVAGVWAVETLEGSDWDME